MCIGVSELVKKKGLCYSFFSGGSSGFGFLPPPPPIINKCMTEIVKVKEHTSVIGGGVHTNLSERNLCLIQREASFSTLFEELP